jgi:hypothetical protein
MPWCSARPWQRLRCSAGAVIGQEGKGQPYQRPRCCRPRLAERAKRRALHHRTELNTADIARLRARRGHGADHLSQIMVVGMALSASDGFFWSAWRTRPRLS